MLGNNLRRQVCLLNEDIGLGTELSLTGSLQFPINAPPVNANINLFTPFFSKTFKILNVPFTLFWKFSSGFLIGQAHYLSRQGG